MKAVIFNFNELGFSSPVPYGLWPLTYSNGGLLPLGVVVLVGDVVVLGGILIVGEVPVGGHGTVVATLAPVPVVGLPIVADVFAELDEVPEPTWLLPVPTWLLLVPT